MADGYISQIKTPDNKVYLLKDSEKTDEKVAQVGNAEDKDFPIILKNTNNTTDETANVKYSNNTTTDATTTKPFTFNPSTGTLKVTQIKIGTKDDSKGLFPVLHNWNQIGASNLCWYRSYINNYYGSRSHVDNWDSGKNIGTAATTSAAAAKGTVNFYNSAAANTTQTKTLLEANANTNSNITITLPSSAGTLALTSQIPTNLNQLTNGPGYVTSSGITSVTIGATSPVQSSTSTAQTGSSASTTISLKDAYGDTKNPYGTKAKNLVLAGPSSGNNAAPTFRALVAADIPDLSWNKITSNKPTTLSGYGITDAKIASGVITLGSNTITPVTSVNGHTGSSVSVTASDLGLASALKYVGTKSSLPTATDSTTYSTYNNGDVITVSNKEYAYVKGSSAAGSSWVELGDEGSYKLKQTAFTNSTGTADGSNTSTTFIYSFSQDANGVITDIKTRKLPTYNNYSHPTGDGNLHVPATGTGNNGKVLKAGSTAGSISWGTLSASDVGAAPSSTVSCTTANVKSALGTVSTTAKKFLKDTGSWAQVDWGDLTGIPSSFSPSSHTHSYITLYEARASTTTLNKLANYVAAGAIFHLVASSSTSATDNGKTPTDANVLQMNWDNNDGYDAQIAVSTDANRMYFRDRPSSKKAWQEVAHAQVGTSDIGSATQPVYMTATGVITAGTALKALAYKDSLTSSDVGAITKLSSSTDNAIVRFDGTSGQVQDSTATINDTGTMTIKGKLIVNPSYDTSNSYNEGIRINQASNGWANIHFGGAKDTTSGNADGAWLIGRRGAVGTYGAVGDFTIEEQGSSGLGLTVHKDSAGATLYISKASGDGLKITNGGTIAANTSFIPIRAMTANMAAASWTLINIGRSADSKNSATFGFYYAGNASNSNYVTIGLHSADNLLKIFATGQTNITKNISSTSVSSGSLVVAGGAGIGEKLYVANDVHAEKYIVNENVTLQWNSTDSSLDFVFA